MRGTSTSNPTPDLIDRLATPEETGLDPALLVPLLKLLATGEPVAIAELAAAAGRAVEAVRSGLAAVPDTEYDAEGRIVGQGLTVRPTPHRFTVEGKPFYTKAAEYPWVSAAGSPSWPAPVAAARAVITARPRAEPIW